MEIQEQHQSPCKDPPELTAASLYMAGIESPILSIQKDMVLT